MYLKDTMFIDMEWFHLAHERMQRRWVFKYDNETLGSIKDGKFLDELNDY